MPQLLSRLSLREVQVRRHIAFYGFPIRQSSCCILRRFSLQFLHEMQWKAHANLKVSKDRSIPVFGLGVAFIDESALSLTPSCKVDGLIADTELIVSELAPPRKELHASSIESIFSEDSENAQYRLHELMSSVRDATGKEDLREHLLMLCLQKVASNNGYNKLVLGSCTSRIARHVISATVKGRGYSLPADIQYIDSRWDVPVMFPLRDCLASDLRTLCQLESLKTLELDAPSYSGINDLVSSFVDLLQEENPSKEHTILRTAEKLVPFSFDKIAESGNPSYSSLAEVCAISQNLEQEESISVVALCALCCGPLTSAEQQSGGRSRVDKSNWEIFAANCCESCSFQILPHDPSSLARFCLLLPEMMVRKVKGCPDVDQNRHNMREKIEDCLLADNEDDT